MSTHAIPLAVDRRPKDEVAKADVITRPCADCGKPQVRMERQLADRSHRRVHIWLCGHCKRVDTATAPLSERQLEVVKMLCEAKSSKEVAVALNLSVKTVETHRANILRQLEMHSIVELVRWAIRNRIVEA